MPPARWRRRDAPFVPEQDEPRAAGPGAEAALDLQQAVAALAPGYRAVLLLHDSWGYTHAEVGALLGVDEGTSKASAHARSAVRRRLAGRATGTDRRTVMTNEPDDWSAAEERQALRDLARDEAPPPEAAPRKKPSPPCAAPG